MKLVIWFIGIGDSIKKTQRDGKCYWTKQNQPEIWEKTHKILQISGFLNYRLTSEFKDSVASQIGHIPFAYKKQKWGNPEVEIFRGFWMISWFKNEFACKEIYRVVIEGLVYALREGNEKIEKVSKTKIRRLAVSGGVSQSDEICQIAADIFNLPVVRGKTFETSGLGAAVLTAFGTGNFSSPNEAVSEMVNYQNEFPPNNNHVNLYEQLYKIVYKKMYKKLEPFYHTIREITGYPERFYLLV